jgi:hypothetical protein
MAALGDAIQTAGGDLGEEAVTTQLVATIETVPGTALQT